MPALNDVCIEVNNSVLYLVRVLAVLVHKLTKNSLRLTNGEKKTRAADVNRSIFDSYENRFVKPGSEYKYSPSLVPVLEDKKEQLEASSVADPDPYVSGPPGFFYHKAKIVRKTLITTVL
jgi:hypothetical protein